MAVVSSLRAWLPKLLLAAVAVLATMGVAEVVLQWTWSTEKVTLVHDPLLGFRGRGNAHTIWHREMFSHPRMVRLNDDGFHDHPRQHEPAPGTRRLVFLGDSFLEAYQVDIDSSFSQRLAHRLSRSMDHVVESVNLGVHGYGLGVYSLQVGQRLAAWHPDAVVLCLFMGNDLHDNFTPIASAVVPRFDTRQGQLMEHRPPARDLRIWLRDEVLARSSLGRFFWLRVIKSSSWAMARARGLGMVSTPDLASHAAGQHEHMLEVGRLLLLRIIADLRQQGLPLHVFIIPDPFLVHDLAQQHRGVGSVVADDERLQSESMVLRLLEAQGVSYTSAREHFVRANLDSAGFYRSGFGHFTDSAHPVVTELLELPLRELLEVSF